MFDHVIYFIDHQQYPLILLDSCNLVTVEFTDDLVVRQIVLHEFVILMDFVQVLLNFLVWRNFFCFWTLSPNPSFWIRQVYLQIKKLWFLYGILTGFDSAVARLIVFPCLPYQVHTFIHWWLCFGYLRIKILFWIFLSDWILV